MTTDASTVELEELNCLCLFFFFSDGRRPRRWTVRTRRSIDRCRTISTTSSASASVATGPRSSTIRSAISFPNSFCCSISLSLSLSLSLFHLFSSFFSLFGSNSISTGSHLHSTWFSSVFTWLNWVSLRFSFCLVFTEFSFGSHVCIRFWGDLNGFYLVLLSFFLRSTWFYRVYWVLPGFTGLYWCLPSFIVFFLV